jgi:hypothetical protein
VSTKRHLGQDAPAPAKKAKHGGSALSNLLRKVENTSIAVVSSTMTVAKSDRLKQEQATKLMERLPASNVKSGQLKEKNGG